MSASSTVRKNASQDKGRVTISTIVTHHHPHEDEFVSIALIEQTGAFDTKDAQIITVKSDEELVLYGYRADTIFVGAGSRLEGAHPWKVFDEHSDVEGRKDRCATDIVAQAMDIEQVVFGELLNEVREHDLKPHSSPTSFAAVIKALYESCPEHEVIAWAMRGARPLCAHVSNPRQLERHTDLFLEISSVAYAEVGRKSGMESQRFSQFLPQIMGSTSSRELTNIFTMFSVIMNENAADARWWLKKAVMGLAQRQALFCRALGEFKKLHTEQLVPVDPLHGEGEERRARIAFMRSDSGLMDKVFRSKEAGRFDLLVLMNLSGQVCIFTNNKSQEGGLNIDALVAMVRWAEISASGRKPHSWWGMAREDDHPAVREWFYFKEGNALFNGSKSKPNIPKTRLGWDDFRYILPLAFTKRGVEKFMRDNRVLASRAES